MNCDRENLITLAQATLKLGYYRHHGFMISNFPHNTAMKFPYCNVVAFDADSLVDAMTFAAASKKAFVCLMGTNKKPIFFESIEGTYCVPESKEAQEGYYPIYRTFYSAEILGSYKLRREESEGINEND